MNLNPARSRTAGPAARLVGRWAAVLVALLLPLLLPGTASAHAAVVSTDPRDGEVLASSPVALTVTFSEPVTLSDTGTSLLDHTGAPVPVTAAVQDRVLTLVPQQPLADGSYLVSFRVLSADSHPVTGGLTFAVGTPSDTVVRPPAPAADSTVTTVKTVVETLRYLTLLLAVGLLTFRLLALPDPLGPSGSRLVLLSRWSALIAAVCSVTLIGLGRVWQEGLGMGALDDPRIWGDWSDTTTAALLVVLAAAVLGVAGTGGRRRAEIATSAGALVGLFGLAVVGHTRVYGPAWLVIGADLVHVLTAALWLGGVVALVLLLTRPGELSTGELAHTVRRFSTVAAWSVAALGVSAVLLYWRIAGAVSTLWTTSHGRWVLVKLGLVLLVLALAAYNRRRLVPALTPPTACEPEAEPAPAADPTPTLRWLRRVTAVEAVLLVAVVAATALLVSQPPRTDEAVTPVGTWTLELQGHTATLTIDPVARGSNRVTLTMIDAAGSPTQPLEDPVLGALLPARDLGPFPASLELSGMGQWTGTLELPLSGDWVLDLGVRLNRYDFPTTRIDLSLQ